MNQPRDKRRPARRTTQRGPTKPVDPWLVPAPRPDVDPITTPDDVTAVLHSLGDPPIAGGDVLARYFAAVVERTAALAAAVAMSAELPAAPPDTTSPDPQSGAPSST